MIVKIATTSVQSQPFIRTKEGVGGSSKVILNKFQAHDYIAIGLTEEVPIAKRIRTKLSEVLESPQ